MRNWHKWAITFTITAASVALLYGLLATYAWWVVSG